MGENKKVNVVVIGSGSAGCAASIYTGRAGLSTVIISGFVQGGQLTTTEDIENYPGFAEKVGGPWLMDQMLKQSIASGAKVIQDEVVSIDFSSRPFKVKLTLSEEILEADTIIIATGAEAKYLGLKSEKEYMGRGVSACAVCDGTLYKGKDVLVVGGGNTAVEEALYLSKLAKNVTLIHRRDKLRSEKILQDRLFSKENVKIIWDTVLEEVLGDQMGVNGVKIKNTKDNSISELKLDGVFIAIGHEPKSSIFKEDINIDKDGYIITEPDSTKTNIDGVFAAGDVQDKIYRQAVTAAGTGCMAALEAEKYLSEQQND